MDVTPTPAQVRQIRRVLSGQDDLPVTIATTGTHEEHPVPDQPTAPSIDAQHVIAALRRQNADLAWRLALAEAQLAQQHGEETA